MNHLKKNIVFSKGNKLFAGDFYAHLDETKAEMELEMHFLTSRILLQKVFSYKCQFCIFKAGLSSQVHIMAGQNVKKAPDALDPNQNVETT